MSSTTIDLSAAHDPSLSLFQKVLLITDGTVTQLIELYAGESIRVHKLENSITASHAAPAEIQSILQTSDAHALLKRSILLCGTIKRYLYAESWFLMDRLPQEMRNKLETTNIPIGLLWREARLETYREIIDCRRERNAVAALHLGVSGDQELLSRTYLLYTQSKPMGVITEKFPTSYFAN